MGVAAAAAVVGAAEAGAAVVGRTDSQVTARDQESAAFATEAAAAEETPMAGFAAGPEPRWQEQPSPDGHTGSGYDHRRRDFVVAAAVVGGAAGQSPTAVQAQDAVARAPHMD